jgi:hypothetical protein
MQSFEITPAPRETAPTRGSVQTGPATETPLIEQFVAVINRTLDGLPPETSADSEPVETPPRGRAKPGPDPLPHFVDPAYPDPNLGLDNIAASILPPLGWVTEHSCGADGAYIATSGATVPWNRPSTAGPGSGSPANELERPALSTDTQAPSAGPNSEAESSAGGERVADPGSVRATSAATPADPAKISTEINPGPAPPTGAATASGTAGISSAQQQVPMQKAEKTNAPPAAAEKNLPVAPASRAGEVLPVKRQPSATFLPHRTNIELSPAPGSQGADAATPAQATPSLDASAQGLSLNPARSLERVQDLMSLHGLRLRDSGSGSLHVIIKPAPDLQLVLDLRLHEGRVEMRATLHRGDFDLLNRHWTELQQQLEPRGIRLAPLNDGRTAAGGDPLLFQQPRHRQSKDDSAPANAAAEFILANESKPVTTNKTGMLHGWESWA